MDPLLATSRLYNWPLLPNAGDVRLCHALPFSLCPLLLCWVPEFTSWDLNYLSLLGQYLINIDWHSGFLISYCLGFTTQI